jgi:hypothetical protein
MGNFFSRFIIVFHIKKERKELTDVKVSSYKKDMEWGGG